MNSTVLSLAFLIAFPTAAGAASWTEMPIEAPGPDGPLAGTRTDVPGDAEPVVLIVPGSGPTDRDGNNPLGVAAATYRMVAHGLAEHGIATVRIDKRGMFGSASAVVDPNAVTIGDYANDLRNWITAIRASTGAKCIWVLGHSEGALVGLTAAAADPAEICGLVLVAAPGQPLDDVVRDQLRANPANTPILAEAEKALSGLKAGRHIPGEEISPPLMALFRPEVQDYLIDMFQRDPAALIAQIQLPTLLLYGDRDLQTPMSEGRLLASAASHAEFTVIPTANHVLKSVTADNREANVAAYADPTLPLAPGVVERIATFVK